MASFDGTNKASSGTGRDIKYYEPTSPTLDALKQSVMAKASPEAIKYIDPLNVKRPTVVVDASTLTDVEWQKIRENSIGSSAVSQIFGECPYPGCTNLDLYHNKIGQKPAIVDNDPTRELLFLYGHLMEEFLHVYTSQKFPTSNLIVDTNIYADPLRPYSTANLDRMMQRSDGTYVHVEFKTSSLFNEDAYANGAIPPHYKRQLIQCQHIMGVWESYLIVSFGRDKNIIRRYVRDLDAEMEQLMELDNFWNNHVLSRIPPVPLGPPDNVLLAIKKYSGNADKTLPEVNLPDCLCAEVEKLNSVVTRIKLLDAEKKRLEFEKASLLVPLAQLMGQVTKAYVTDGQTAYDISYKPRIGSRSCNFDQLELDYPQLYNQYISRGAESRLLTIKEVDIRP